jgi:multidrug resistance efflux pump
VSQALLLPARSDEVQAILSARPPWLVRWGISAISFALVALLAATWIIRYPDVLRGRVVITAREPPVPIVARVSGRLDRLDVKDGLRVDSGAVLGVIENPADADEVLSLERQLRGTDIDAVVAGDAVLALEPHAALGELQASYSAFVRDYRVLQHFRGAGAHAETAEAMRLQSALARKKMALRKAQYERSRTLAVQGLMAQSELMAAELSYLESRGALLDLEQHVDRAELDVETAALLSFKQLVSGLAVWKDRYALVAPLRGTVCFGQFRSDHQFVAVNDVVMTIVPESGAAVGRLTLPRTGAGKARSGQRVLVALDDYPYQEFGLLEGVVESISALPRENEYAVDVSLPRNLTTSYGKAIAPRPELRGSAEVVTDDDRLIWRLLRPLRHAASYAR